MTGEAWRTTWRTNHGHDETMKVEESEERKRARKEESEEVKRGKQHVEQSETACRQQGH